MLSALLPGGFRAWRERRQALRELEKMNSTDEAMLSLDESNPVNRAKTALLVGDRLEAARFWAEARARIPKFVLTSHDSLEVLLGLGRFDEAEALMLEGRKQFPHDKFYAQGYAEVAGRQFNNAEAATRWAAVRKAFPSYWMGYARGAGCLTQIGEFDEAEAILKQAIAQFPEQIHCRIEQAKTADRRQDWPEALRRWEIVRTQFKHPAGVVGAARALVEMGKLDEADKLLQELRYDSRSCMRYILRWPTSRHDAATTTPSNKCWEEILRRFPLVQFGYYEAAQRFAAMGKISEAEDVLRQAVERLPQEIRPAVEYATFAHDRKNWPEAARRWQALREAFPDRRDAYILGAQALQELGRLDEAVQLRAEHARRFKH